MWELHQIRNVNVSICSYVDQLRALKNDQTCGGHNDSARVCEGPPASPLSDRPTSLLAVELVIKIVLEAQWEDPRIALTMSSLCQHYRQAVLGSPMLWNQLDINFGPSLARLQIQRSGTYPLHVNLSLSPLISEGDGIIRFHPFFDAMSGSQYRVRHIVALMQYHSWGSMTKLLLFNQPGESAYSTLEDLTFGCREDGTFLFANEAQNILDMPSLHTVKLFRVQVSSDPLRPSNMTDLTFVQDGEITSNPRIFLCTPKLESLSLTGDWLSYEDEGFDVEGQIFLGSLMHLEISRMSQGQLVECFSDIRTPNLESLKITFLGGRGASFDEDKKMLEFLERNTKLQRIEFANCVCNYPDEWRNIYRALPNVTHLRIPDSSPSAGPVYALIDKSLCPLLKSLVINNYYSRQALWAMVVSRSRFSGTLGQDHSTIESLLLRGVDRNLRIKGEIDDIRRLVREVRVEYRIAEEQDQMDESESELEPDVWMTKLLSTGLLRAR